MASISYYENKIELGIEYDWRLIEKEFHKLGVPKGYYEIPWNAIRNGDKILIGLSERSTGKTTTYILLGMVMNKLYGTHLQYVRATEDELKPSHAEKLVEVIRTYNDGQYLKRCTDGRWNSIFYHWKKFYYCNRDENGTIVEKSEIDFIQCLSVDRHGDYKSSYNAPKGDLILFDEFIGKFYRPDEAIHFLDLCKTIIRDRYSPLIVMMANTINQNSMYFEELEVSKQVKSLKKGESKQIITERGTHIYLELIDVKRGDSVKHKVNSLFFGFKNTKLASITGGELFAFASVPHILQRGQCNERRIIANNIYIETGTDLLNVELVYNEEQGYHLEVHRANRTYDDSYILTLNPVANDRRYHYGLGEKNYKKTLTDMISSRKVYFSSNEVGAVFSDYYNRFLMERNRI